MPGSATEPKVLYEDNHLLVVTKPFGMLSQGDATGDASVVDWAKGYIQHRYAKPGAVYLGLVHRLDRPVGGVLLLARTSKAAARLSAQFRERLTVKDYLALVEVPPQPTQGRLQAWIKPGRGSAPSTVCEYEQPGAQQAVLSYRTLGAAPAGTLLEVVLGTGRKHQIRAQLAHAGWPICGDRRYGAKRPWPRGQIALWAHRLTITHPVTRETLTFSAPAPPEWFEGSS